ncbi:tetratricopeptide repeat protein [Planctomycetota bacterium]
MTVSHKYKSPAVIGLLALLVLASAIGTFSANQHWATGGSLCRKLLEAHPGHADVLAFKARIITGTEGLSAALKLLTETPLLKGRRTDAYFNALGTVQYLRRDWDAAYNTFDRISSPSRFASGARVMQAHVLFQQGLPQEALQILEGCLEADPRNWDAARAKGMYFFRQKKWFEAGAAYSAAIDAGRRDVTTLRPFIIAMEHLGDEHDAVGKPGTARRAYFMALGGLEQLPRRAQSGLNYRLQRVSIMVKAEDVKGALGIFRDLEGDLGKYDAEERMRVRKEFAFFCMKFMLFKKADELFADIRAAEPGNPDHIFWQATAKYKRRHLGDAEKMFREAMNLYRQRANARGVLLARHNLAEIDLFVKDYARAADTFRELVGEVPDSWQARANLAEALIRQGEFEEGAAIIRELADKIPESSFSLIKLRAMLAKEKRHEQSLARHSD